jgi:hypothetical protein
MLDRPHTPTPAVDRLLGGRTPGDQGRDQAAAVLGLLGDGKSNGYDEPRARAWVARAVTAWRDTPYREAAELLHEIARHLLELRGTVSRLVAAAGAGDRLLRDTADEPRESVESRDRLVRDQADELQGLFGYLVCGENDTQPEIIARLLAFETTQDVLGGRGTVTEQELEFIEISARSRSTFGGPEEPAQKVAGIQLAHFGAFYKNSWARQ